MNTFTMSIGLQKKAMLRHFDEIASRAVVKRSEDRTKKALLRSFPISAAGKTRCDRS